MVKLPITRWQFPLLLMLHVRFIWSTFFRIGSIHSCLFETLWVFLDDNLKEKIIFCWKLFIKAIFALLTFWGGNAVNEQNVNTYERSGFSPSPMFKSYGNKKWYLTPLQQLFRQWQLCRLGTVTYFVLGGEGNMGSSATPHPRLFVFSSQEYKVSLSRNNCLVVILSVLERVFTAEGLWKKKLKRGRV